MFLGGMMMRYAVMRHVMLCFCVMRHVMTGHMVMSCVMLGLFGGGVGQGGAGQCHGQAHSDRCNDFKSSFHLS